MDKKERNWIYCWGIAAKKFLTMCIDSELAYGLGSPGTHTRSIANAKKYDSTLERGNPKQLPPFFTMGVSLTFLGHKKTRNNLSLGLSSEKTAISRLLSKSNRTYVQHW
ncbi:hypothetical protein CEXT_515611 [Caerostris extrusa]|uniref:Uncharacterized protein n=1 Tax=Caerostris extrusa TaxID=172846 RepID=A0AAV4NXP3_CAEEX|nr:hypothetical protein CEXT_515611 [Caerostris extrusa]